MNPGNYLVRAPLVDAAQHPRGYRLAWQHPVQYAEGPGQGQPAPLLELLKLLEFAARTPGAAKPAPFFIEAHTSALPAEDPPLRAMASTVLLFDPADLSSAQAHPLARSLKAQGFGLALRNPPAALAGPGGELAGLLTHVAVGLGNPDRDRIIRMTAQAMPAVEVVIDRIADWAGFEACAELGLAGFFGNLCALPRSPGPVAEVGSQTGLVVQLMRMVQDNADIRELEKIFKRDAMLSYKLLRYINAAGFGLHIQIESLRHAITMLGYQPLYRWLALLLATTGTVKPSSALLEAALVRGRFVELLGKGLLPASEAGNLFVVGLFSLLDQLLGVPMDQLMGQVFLPDAIVQALLARHNIYGPFLALAEACEQDDGCASEIADSLFMTPSQVNKAHVSAIVWAQELKL